MSIDVQEFLADARVWWTDDILRFRDTDMNGHVNNPIYAVLAESGRVQYFRARITPTVEDKVYYVVARLVVEFRAELHYPGRVRTGTWLKRLGRSSLGLGQIIIGADGALAAETEAVCVMMDGASRRPKALPDTTRAAMEPLLRESPPTPE